MALWWLRRLPDLKGIASDFKDILSSLSAVRISALAPLEVTFFKGPVLSLLVNAIVEARVSRLINKLIVLRGTPILAKI
jgi:tetrahydromethanopterin S-methyltransferase subunit C